jgi:hypothetical protein
MLSFSEFLIEKDDVEPMDPEEEYDDDMEEGIIRKAIGGAAKLAGKAVKLKQKLKDMKKNKKSSDATGAGE